MAWYIEAWDVIDGQAFGGFRSQDGQPPSELVLVAPPSFEPVPVSDIATALWATRTTFQEGFIDRDEREVVFPSLDHLIDTVRRAYLAGGIGDSPPPEGGPEPGPEGPPSPPPEKGPQARPRRPPPPDPLRRWSTGLADALARGDEGHLVHLLSAARPAQVSELLKALVQETEIEPPALAHESAAMSYLEGLLQPTARGGALHRIDPETVFDLSLPSGWSPLPHPSSWGDHLLAMVADRTHLRGGTDSKYWISLLGAALIVAQLPDPSRKDLDEAFEAAAHWLARELRGPGLEVVPAAEEALVKLARSGLRQ